MKTFFYGPRPGPDTEALKWGFRKCGELATNGNHQAITLALSTKGNLQGLISDLFGDPVVRALDRDKHVNLGSIVLHLATQRIEPRHTGPVLAAWTSIDQTKRLAASFHVTALIYLPWLDEELEAFKKSFPSALPLAA